MGDDREWDLADVETSELVDEMYARHKACVFGTIDLQGKQDIYWSGPFHSVNWLIDEMKMALHLRFREMNRGASGDEGEAV